MTFSYTGAEGTKMLDCNEASAPSFRSSLDAEKAFTATFMSAGLETSFFLMLRLVLVVFELFILVTNLFFGFVSALCLLICCANLGVVVFAVVVFVVVFLLRC